MRVRYTADRSAVSMIVPTCPSDEAPAEPETLPPLKIRYSVFFDGTGNNMFNTQTRLTTDTAADDSYRNDFSNIAKLANYLDITTTETNSFHVGVYVEGMGTQHGASDDINGMGFGTGARGIVERVTRAIEQISRETTRLAGDGRTVDEIKIDSFGFSRGAASARHFLYRINNGVQPLTWHFDTNHIHVNSLLIPFVGLYDCVASFRTYGLIGAGGSIEDDTYELHLNAFDEAQKVVHIVAADEFRKNFPVTNIASAGSGKGVTYHIPGAHSDVGGGYNNISEADMHENNLPILRIPFTVADGWEVINPIQRRFRTEIEWLENLGWYHHDEFIIEPGYNPERENTILSFSPLCVNRRNISNSYPRIALKMMKTEAANNGLVFLSTLESENPLRELSSVYGYINSHKSRSAGAWNRDNSQQMKDLRHGYFHFSSHYTPTSAMGVSLPIYESMASQFYSAAHGYEDSQRNMMIGTRKRKVLEG